jgi:hypothetical protein
MYKEGKQILKEYYRVLAIKPDKSQKDEQVKARAAMMTAMRHCNLTTSSIANVFDSDSSTVSHHSNKHEVNLNNWKGYDKCYILAMKLCTEEITHKDWQANLYSVKVAIAKMKQIQKKLERKIQSKQFTNV